MAGPPRVIESDWDRVVAFSALRAAALRAARGCRRVGSAAAFLCELETEVLRLQGELVSGVYRPGRLTAFRIRDPKPRVIQVAPFRDRVVHHAVCAVVQPAFERYHTPHDFACRVGRGPRAALQAARRCATRHAWFVKMDVRHYFETVPHAPLLALLERKVADARVRALIVSIVHAGAPGQSHGLPIGNLTSQLLANVLLARGDRYMLEVVRVPALVRYMDDVLLFGEHADGVRASASALSAFWREALGLEEKREARVVGPTAVGVPFLGFRVWSRWVRLDAARCRRAARRLRRWRRSLARGAAPVDVQRRASSLVDWLGQASALPRAIRGGPR